MRIRYLVLLALVPWAAPGNAAEPGTLGWCRTMPEPEQRLSCYDALPENDARITQRQPPSGDPRREAAVGAVERTPYGKLIVRLDDGEAWSQVDSARLDLVPGDRVRIEAAASGSFLLEKLPQSRRIRVRPVD